MASFKQVTLKDPATGEYLSPRVYGALEYEVVEDGEVYSSVRYECGYPTGASLLLTFY